MRVRETTDSQIIRKMLAGVVRCKTNITEFMPELT